MKLRLSKDSIRLRMTEAEASQWKDSGMIEETVLFSPDSRFIYRLECTSSGTDVEAHLADGLLLIVVPESMARAWHESDEEAIHSHHSGGVGTKISIERELPCKHGSNETP